MGREGPTPGGLALGGVPAMNDDRACGGAAFHRREGRPAVTAEDGRGAARDFKGPALEGGGQLASFEKSTFLSKLDTCVAKSIMGGGSTGVAAGICGGGERKSRKLQSIQFSCGFSEGSWYRCALNMWRSSKTEASKLWPHSVHVCIVLVKKKKLLVIFPSFWAFSIFFEFFRIYEVFRVFWLFRIFSKF